MAGPWSKVAPGEPPSLPTVVGPEEAATAVQFTGPREELFGRLLFGYLLMLPTLGVYRFWVTTMKRRFYWQHTVIDGDPLEYTGNARQLLVGFLFAIAFFLPVYIAFFVFSTQASLVGIIGYAVVGAAFWYFLGYAQYRGRDFRLSRTLWRGIRFDQKGSAISYATRRFLWSLFVICTLGLAYPFMAASLWRYRYANTWFGDRQLNFAGTWKTIAGPFYRAWGLVALVGGLLVGLALAGNPAMLSLALLATLVACALAVPYWRSREASRMFSSISVGQARVEARIKARSLFVQYLALGAVIVILLVGLLFATTNIVVPILTATGTMPTGQVDSLAINNWGSAAIVVGGYLLTFGTFSLLSETIVDYGWWALVASGAKVINVRSLNDVRAIDEDKALVGEGLADALNVGAF